MDLSRVLSKVARTLFPFSDFLYLLQQEEYDGSRYRKWLPKFFFRRNFVSKGHFTYTLRAKFLLAFSIVLFVLLVVFLASVFEGITRVAVFVLAFYAIPLIVWCAHSISVPLFLFAHKMAWEKARKRIVSHAPMKVVMIAGSFGKTTTKALIYEFLRLHYKVQVPPGNINTTTGIAQWILNHLEERTNLLLLEVDGYKAGEIAESTRIAPPDISVITNVGDQHLERFKTKKRLIEALSEAFHGAKNGAILLSDTETASHYPFKERITLVDTTMTAYEGTPLDASHFSVSNRKNLSLALSVASLLQIPREYIEEATRNFTPPERRQQPTFMHGYDAIDDSYNISFSTARAGIAAARVLAKTKRKKLLVVAAGIPEVGPQESEDNKAFGELLASEADHTALLQSMFAKDVAKGLGGGSFAMFKNFDIFLKEAHTLYPPREWVVLFQPALPDIYY